MAATVKFFKPGGQTRRAVFSARPTWTDLVAKIHYLYTIPNEYIAVSYQDTEGDEVTLSTQCV
jgi:hypothetical protein